MGSPVSSVVANIFMMNFEKRALQLVVHFEPRLWKRYVDEVFSITKMINTEWLLTHINGIDANIHFTIEREHENLLPFLDVSVKRRGGQIKTSVYRKPTYTGRVLNIDSHHFSVSKKGGGSIPYG